MQSPSRFESQRADPPSQLRPLWRTPVENPDGGLTAAIPMDKPYCSCKSHGLQLQPLWINPTAAVRVMAYSCNPYG